jgi:DNA-binding IclR family transcriptional regulator
LTDIGTPPIMDAQKKPMHTSRRAQSRPNALKKPMPPAARTHARTHARKDALTAASGTPVAGVLDTDTLATDRQFATNLARGFDVLRAFTPSEPMLGNREISDRTGLPKATVSRLTYTLTLLGYLTRLEKFQKYRLGSGVLSLGYPLLASLQVRQIARPYMEQIARDTGCSVNLGMRDRLCAVYVDTIRADAGNLYQPDIGSTRPLLSTSMGRALLLGGAAAERTAILNRLKVEDPDRFALDLPAFEADRKQFPARGYCHSPGEWRREVHAIAVPIRQRDEVLALNCTLSTYRLRKGMLENEVAPRLLEAALRIEQACGLH